MSTVKPYIITLKTILCYEDPAPTVEQVLNELNIDVIEISIEEAAVSPKAATKTVWKPLGELLGDPAPVPAPTPAPVAVEVAKPVKVAPPARASTGWLYAKEEAPFDVYNLDREGPSIKILSVLHRAGAKGSTAEKLREVTGITLKQSLTTLMRLRSSGRVEVVGKAADNHNIYVFVQ
jgi:hypothetical protein